ncbi:four helix bundle protein [Gloeocapsopsis sp. IPPAS B-1203]|uniref:four helix bundle protein n=1 Tax=Gloeocapsopsis sp. IPPAS B-1203 TaxID=2049454 RepID=UPI0025A20F7E|nr:four helix bundle protein [Gloeocapsopsis sp. IPPAS B-1203]
MDIAEQVYLLTQSFPKQETYGLTNQLQKAAVSIPSNIAEGHTRDSTKEFLHFIIYSVRFTSRIGNTITPSTKI